MDRDKLPRNVIELPKIPRTFNGKLLRRALREMAASGQAQDGEKNK